MSVLNLNFPDASDSYPTVEPGVYQARVEEIREIEHVGERETPALPVALRIQEVEDGGNQESVGLTVNDMVFVQDYNDASKPSVALTRLLKSAGFDPTALGQSFDTQELQGTVVKVRVKIKKGKDQDGNPVDRTRVTYLKPDES